MAEVTSEMFLDMLKRTINLSREMAQRDVVEPLPTEYVLELGGLGQSGKEISLEEAVSHLYQGGRFPRIINVAVKGVARGMTIIWLGPSGHSGVSTLEETSNTPEGTGPFKRVGLMLRPSIWDRPRPLTRRDLEEAAPDWARSE